MVYKLSNKQKCNLLSRDLWRTPQELFNILNHQYRFVFDCCASIDNTKCLKFSDNFGEVISCPSPAWMNPPFSNAEILFIQFFKIITKGVAIYRSDNLETKIWQKIILPNASWIFIPNKRITYKGLFNKWDRPVFGSALIGVGLDLPKGISGTVLQVVKQRKEDYSEVILKK